MCVCVCVCVCPTSKAGAQGAEHTAGLRQETGNNQAAAAAAPRRTHLGVAAVVLIAIGVHDEQLLEAEFGVVEAAKAPQPRF